MALDSSPPPEEHPMACGEAYPDIETKSNAGSQHFFRSFLRSAWECAGECSASRMPSLAPLTRRMTARIPRAPGSPHRACERRCRLAASLVRHLDFKCRRRDARLFPLRKREGDLDLARSDFLFDTHGVVQPAASTSLFD